MIFIVSKELLAELLNKEECTHYLQIERSLLKDGFHREILTQIDGRHNLPTDAILLLLEHFSESIYLDKFQLEEMKRFGSIHTVKFLQEMDLEIPAAFSKPNYIFIFRTM